MYINLLSEFVYQLTIIVLKYYFSERSEIIHYKKRGSLVSAETIFLISRSLIYFHINFIEQENSMSVAIIHDGGILCN